VFFVREKIDIFYDEVFYVSDIGEHVLNLMRVCIY